MVWGLARWRSPWQFIGIAVLCLVLAASCGDRTTRTTQTSSPGDRLVIASVEKPRTLDPADGYEVPVSDIITSLGDRLYTYQDQTSMIVPQLATALPKVSPDGITYTISLRQGVTFHDGEPFNAKAMVFSLERFVKNGGKPSTLLGNVMESVQASGEFEITIKLKAPFAPFPSLLAFPGLCAVSPKAYEIGEGKFKPNIFVGTGPYKLSSFTPNLIKVDVFDKYWGDKPVSRGIDFSLLGNSATLVNSFTTGAVDVAFRDLTPSQVVSLKQEAPAKGYQLLERDGTRIDYLALNTKTKPLDQVEVRQAIASVIDRPLIISRVYKELASPAYTTIPTGFPGSQPVFKSTYGDGNIAKAKELLTRAGFSTQKPFELEMWYSSSSVEREQTATLLKEYVAQKLDGIMTIKPQPVESTTLFANIAKGIYPSYLIAWLPDFGDPDNYLTPFFACNRGSAATGCEDGDSQTQGFFYYSEPMLKLLADQRREIDPGKRQQLFAQIQELMVKDVPLVPLFQRKEFAFAQKGVKNLQLNPVLGLPIWKMSK